jgi:hypothetical protein
MAVNGENNFLIAVYVNDILVARDTYSVSSGFYPKIVGVYSYGKQNVAFNRITLSEL